MREPHALIASAATFAANWRDSNCTIRAGNHRNRKTVKIKTEEIRMEAFMELILPAIAASDSASHAQTALASSSATWRVA